MADSHIDLRVVFTDAETRDWFKVFLHQFSGESPGAALQFESASFDSQCILALQSSPVQLAEVKAMGPAALEFHVRGDTGAASIFVGRLVQSLKRLAINEIIYADLNEQVMEIAVYYHSDRAECSYETGFYGDADEALWEADSDGSLLDTVRELALANQLKMPSF